MSIRLQLVLVTAAVSLLLTLLVMPFAQAQLDRSFRDFELRHARQEAQRVQLLIEQRGATLALNALDYGNWNETVAFLAGKRPDWLARHLSQDVFENLKVDQVVIGDAQLRPRAMRHNDTAQHVPDPAVVLTRGDTCAAAMAGRAASYRFDVEAGRPWVMACSPVMATGQAGAPVVGVLAWGAELTATRVADLARLIRTDFALQPAGIAATGETDVQVHEDGLAVHAPVRNGDGRVNLEAVIQLPRPLLEQRAVAGDLLRWLVLAAVGAPSLLMLIFFEAYVVRRLRRVSAWVRSMRRGQEHPELGTPAAPTGAGAGFAELAMLVDDFTDLTDRLEAARARWQAEATHDALTGLGNRSRLLADLAAQLRPGADPRALLLVDLDGFKAVNDLLGHPAGDAVLQEFARNLQAMLPRGAAAYRMGGDEFAVLGKDPGDGSLALAQSLCARLTATRHAQGKPLEVTASIGVAASPDDDGTGLGASELLTHADIALYEAKRSGRGTCRRFSAATHREYREQIDLQAGLRAALAAGAVHAWFQPIVDARSGRVVALEALARWHDPVHGWVPPVRFIAVAERSGTVIEVDLAVSTSALHTFASLRRAMPALRLNLNVSAQSLVDPQFVDRFSALLVRAAVPPDAVALEITESDLGIAQQELDRAIGALRALGVALVVDDFGVGASTLGRIAHVRPSAVKIDGSFVRDLAGDGGRICRAIIELARELGMASVAEFVESDDESTQLAAMGCSELQGYGIATPMPGGRLVEWLEARCEPATADRG